MAKKFGKFLLFTAAIGAAGVAAYYYMQKKDASLLGDTDEDYDDFSTDSEEEKSRSYVPLTHETSTESSGADSFTPLSEKAAKAAEAVEADAKEAVEEFFNDGSDSKSSDDQDSDKEVSDEKSLDEKELDEEGLDKEGLDKKSLDEEGSVDLIRESEGIQDEPEDVMEESEDFFDDEENE